jgi:PqqD family protein of HPr-rel-A system
VSDDEVLRLGRDVLVTELEGEAVVLDVRTGRYFTANRSGAVLLRRLRDGATRDALVAALVAAFGVDEAAARRDALAWLARLADRGLVVADRPAP